MNTHNILETIAAQLKTLSTVNHVMQAQDSSHAQKTCSEGRSAELVIFCGKGEVQAPKDWLSKRQWCDWEIGVLLNQTLYNHPRKVPQSDDMAHDIITALSGFSLAPTLTPMWLRSLQSLDAPQPQKHTLLLFTTRGIIGTSSL